jgi:hypothetical protein
LPLEPPIKVSPEYAALLKACQGEQTAKQIARQLLQDSRLGFKNEAAIYRMLQDLRDRRLISWEWVIPIPEQTKPEEPLTRMLARIEDEQLRQKSLSLLNELNEARKNVARASGDPQKLACSLADLDATFTRMTGAAPTRSAGHMYAARTLVYEDCRRDIEVTISPEMIHSLGPALTLLLDGARWVSYEFAARARQVFEKIYTDLTRKSGSPVVEAVAFYEKLRPLVFSGESAIHKTVLKDFYKRWSQILQVDSKERQVSLSSVELRPRVLSAFAAPRAGWPYARFHSPDLMIAAASPAAIRRGDYLFVLGELHPGGISISNGIFVDQHPVPQELFQALERDLPESRVLFIAPKHQPGANARTSLCLINPHDYFLDYSLDSAHFAPQSTLALGNIVFERHNAKLMARTRDGRVAFDAVEFLGFLLTTLSGADLKIAPPARHTPRICIDRLCVTRESWLFSPAEVSFVEEKDEAFRFLAARRWAQDRGMPRFVFVKTPAEVKPFFVDFDSPVLINVFTKMVRRVLSDNHTDPLISMPANPLITVSEMLPTPEQLWLTDAEGQFYTSELRMVAVDLLDKANRHGTDAASDSLTS